VRIERVLWAGVTAYFVVIAAIYLAVGGEPAGVTVLVVAAAFGGLVAGWSWRWSRSNGSRASDLATADIADEVGEAGVFPAASLRPIGIAAGFTIAMIGFALGSWMVVVGIALLSSQVGLVVRDRDA
jgi:hypothetical protein